MRTEPKLCRRDGVEMTFELFDFNADLSVALPAPKEAIEFEALDE